MITLRRNKSSLLVSLALNAACATRLPCTQAVLPSQPPSRLSADHFGADHNAVLCGNIGELQHWSGLLAQVADAYFRRSDYAV